MTNFRNASWKLALLRASWKLALRQAGVRRSQERYATFQLASSCRTPTADG